MPKKKKRSIAKQVADTFVDPYVVMTDPLGSYTGYSIGGESSTGRIIIRNETPTQDADDL